MKRILFLFIFSSLLCSNVKSQADSKKLIGKWKVIKVHLGNNVVFDLDDLTSSYNQFYKRQKQQVYKDSVSANDSLFIQFQFEKTVNDINRMFIEFKTGGHYITNGFNKDGSPSEKTVTGIYYFNPVKKALSTYLNGNKNRVTKYNIAFTGSNILVMKYAKEINSMTLTCKKVFK